MSMNPRAPEPTTKQKVIHELKAVAGGTWLFWFSLGFWFKILTDAILGK